MKIKLLLFFSLPFVLFSQTLSEKLESYENSYLVEKVYLNHDKPIYSRGDIIWAKVYVLDGRSHQAFDASPVVYVDWIAPNGEVLNSYTLSIQEGAASLDIPTSESDSTGRYLIRAYTRYQKNFSPEFLFQKEIFLLDNSGYSEEAKKEELTANINLQFYPEGGELVEGMVSQVAFELSGAEGQGIEAEGDLFDSDGNLLQKIKPLNEGIGTFELQPEAGKHYYADFVIKGEKKRFPLPKALAKGYVLQANNINPQFLQINLNSNTPHGMKGATLLGHIRGQIFLTREFSDEKPVELVLGKKELPSGILHFTVFDEEERPVCERLVFNKNPLEKIKVGLVSEKERFGKRELIELEIGTYLQDKLTPAQLSISVFDAGYDQAFSQGLSIDAYLLLQSDLPQNIPHISQYFQKEDMRSQIILDQLMMCKGWRRFNWQDVLKQKVPELLYPPEENLTIAGKIKKHKSEEVIKADVFLSVLSGMSFASLNLTTEEDGIFYFTGFDFPDTTDVLIQANYFNPKKKKKKLKEGEVKSMGNKNVDIELMNFHELKETPAKTYTNRPEQGEAIEELVEEIQEIHLIDSTFESAYNITLEEVNIEASREFQLKRRNELKATYRNQGMFMYSSTPKVFLDDFPKQGQIHRDLYGVINALVPGVRVERAADTIGVFIGRSESLTGPPKSALIVYDGMPMNNASANRIQADQIKVIDVLKGLQASSAWGAAGAGGVLLITSRDPNDRQNLLAAETKIKGVLNLRHPGYYQARTFYSPNYNITTTDPDKPDTRTTLFWNPNIRITDETSQVDFYSGDRSAEYLIWIEGISETGIPFSGGKKILIED